MDNCGQLKVATKVAKVFEGFRLVTSSTKPPTDREKRLIAAAIAENDGEWEPIRDMVRDVTAREIARGNKVERVTYGLTAWKNEQEKQRKTVLGAIPADPRAAALVRSLSGASASPVQRRPDAAPVATGLTPEQEAARKQLLAHWKREAEDD